MHDNQKARKRENEISLRFTFYVLHVTLIALICLSPAFGQENTGKVEGKIIDKQRNLPLAQQQVILQIHQGEDVRQRETVTDENGWYVFNDLSMAFDLHYTISTTYEGKDYVERDLVLSEWVPELKVSIEIAAFMDDPSKVKVRQHSIVITPPPADHAPDGAVSVMEIIQVENTSDLAFQTSLNGQQTGVYFYLPDGYEDLRLDQIFKQELVTDTNRLVSNQPLVPGTTSLGFSYIIHIGSNLDFSRGLTFDTDQLYVFIAEGMPLAPQSRILGASRQERIHEMVYTIYATNPAKPLSAGQTADLRFKIATAAPASQGEAGSIKGQPYDPKLIALIAIAAFGAGCFLVAAFFKVRSAATQRAESETLQPVPDASWLRKLDPADLERTRIARLEVITRLEEMYEKEEISERVYNRLRKEQADLLAAVLARIKE
jgi:hypothetical protein